MTILPFPAPGRAPSSPSTSAPVPGRTKRRRASRGVLPGFALSFGYTITCLGLIVLIPLAGLAWRSADLGWQGFLTTVLTPRALAACRVTFGMALAAGLVNAVFGLVVAWVLARYTFPLKRIVDAMVDLPFALPTAVAGIALTALYSENGWLGSALAPLGIKVAFTPLGIGVAMVFVGLPFVVRTVQPVLLDLEVQMEEVAATLGATRFQTVRQVILPTVVPPLLTGFALAFARAVGEYGSIVFISGNMPMKTEIVPLLIVTKLEQYDYAGATAIALVMLLASFGLLLAINLLGAWSRRRAGVEAGR